MWRTPARRIARMNASGATDAQRARGLLLPRAAVAPHATCSFLISVMCTPFEIAVQMSA